MRNGLPCARALPSAVVVSIISILAAGLPTHSRALSARPQEHRSRAMLGAYQLDGSVYSTAAFDRGDRTVSAAASASTTASSAAHNMAPPPPVPEAATAPALARSGTATKGHVLANVSDADLAPTRDYRHGHMFYTLVPSNPCAVVMMMHGCVHGGHNWFPQSPACVECRGLPEELSHVRQALALGYAVIAPSSSDQQTGCWSFTDDAEDVASLTQEWMEENSLDGLPLYGLGVSSGASFALKLARFLKFDGMMSEAYGVEPEAWGLDEVEGAYPPTLFISMERDADTKALIEEDYDLLTERGTPAEVVKVYPRQVYPTYFSDRHPGYISSELSQRITWGLQQIGMIDSEGSVLEDPRYTDRPWLDQLQAKVPAVEGDTQQDEDGRALPQWPDTAESTAVRAVWSLMNLAYAQHEIISDYATAAFLWFEGGGKDSIQPLLDAYTYSGSPPSQEAVAPSN